MTRHGRSAPSATLVLSLLLTLAGCGSGVAGPTPVPSSEASASPAPAGQADGNSTPSPVASAGVSPSSGAPPAAASTAASAAPAAAPSQAGAPSAAPSIAGASSPAPSGGGAGPASAPGYEDLILFRVPDPSGGPNGQFWLIKAGGSGLRELAAGTSAHWNAGGSEVEVVALDDACVPSLTDYPVDGGSPTHVAVDFRAGDGGFEWTPDGTRLAFFRFSSGRMAPPCHSQGTATASAAAYLQDLYVVNADGSGFGRVASKVPKVEPTAWMPDDSSIFVISQGAFDNIGPILRFDVGTGQSNTVVPAGAYSEVTVSPDGQFLSYTQGTTAKSRLHVAGIDDTDDRDVGVASGQDDRLVWGGTDKHAAVLRDEVQADHTLAGHLLIFDPTASPVKLKDLATDAEPRGQGLGWSPGDEALAYVRGGGIGGSQRATIFLINSDGSGKVELAGTYGADWVSWQPR